MRQQITKQSKLLEKLLFINKHRALHKNERGTKKGDEKTRKNSNNFSVLWFPFMAYIRLFLIFGQSKTSAKNLSCSVNIQLNSENKKGLDEMGKSALMLDDGSCKVEFITETPNGKISTGNRPADVQIRESVGLHGRNIFEDVYKIQYALNKVPPIDGGPPSPIAIDGKCGPQTIKTIQNFQLKHFGWSGADGRIDPHKQTHCKLIEISGRYDVYPSLPLDMVNDAWFFAAMMQHVPFTKLCIHAAMSKVLSAMNGGLFGGDALSLLNRHFLIDKNLSPQSAMQKIYDTYGYMLNVLNRPDNFFTLDTDNRGETVSTVAFARLGGFFEKDKEGNKVTNGRIVFRRGAYFATGIPDFAAFVFIHELRHFVEREKQEGHFGKGWVTDDGMKKLSAQDRLSNCDTYAGFALEAKHGIMERPGWVKSSQFR